MAFIKVYKIYKMQLQNKLDGIIAHKRREVGTNREKYPVALLERRPWFEAPCLSLREHLRRPEGIGLIAEFKRASPSRGTINTQAPVERTTTGYVLAGASALSVLTDQVFFKGSNDNLTTARRANACPILRKDFIVDEYQLIEAKSIGADAVLLLAAVLRPAAIRRLAAQAHTLGLEVVLEIHDAAELEAFHAADIDVLGVNNRDLRSFTVDLNHAFEMVNHLPAAAVRISESGIRQPEDVVALRQAGYDGVLIGETFMRHSRPEQACDAFVRAVKSRQP